MKKLELLSPAKNLETGIAAINCGADAVYIGAPRYGARSVAGNKIQDIQKLILYAHKYYARVYITINTILYDNELAEVQSLLNQFYNLGADAVIIQDTGILELELPPIPIFASTQMHNNTLEKIKFLQEVGIQRIIMARELSIQEIQTIREHTTVDLEFFVHGALCVSYSGQCYFSQALFKRSGNRGECAQPCRMLYSLEDSKGNVIIKDKYLLSLKDLNLSTYLKDLVDAGITSFKIEGRLKDINYVKNITSLYRQELDKIIGSNNSLKKSSSGKVSFPFSPDPERTFNRGYTSYFIKGRQNNLISPDTQKSVGKYVGDVNEVLENCFIISSEEKLNNGDGICFFDRSNTLCGMNIVRTEGSKIFVLDTSGVFRGTKIYRNRENEFNRELNKKGLKRQIDVAFTIFERNSEIIISAEDEDKNYVEIVPGSLAHADNPLISKSSLIKQLSKSGDTIFNVREIKINLVWNYFIPVSQINEIRRNLLTQLEECRIKDYLHIHSQIEKNSYPYPYKVLDYRWNVVNEKAIDFYKRHSAEVSERGFEKLNDIAGKTIMKCRYCIKDQLSLCPKKNVANEKSNYSEPFYLVGNKRKYKLKFDCKNCEMGIIL